MLSSRPSRSMTSNMATGTSAVVEVATGAMLASATVLEEVCVVAWFIAELSSFFELHVVCIYIQNPVKS